MRMRRFVTAALVVASWAVFSACSRSVDPPRPAASASATPKGTLVLGAPISLQVVPLAEIAKGAARYEGQSIATTGKVTAVCQEMGCWMELQDESGDAHVRMHGHTFFVPKTASGHIARVQAKVLRSGGVHCEDSPSPDPALAHIELDATGVELD